MNGDNENMMKISDDMDKFHTALNIPILDRPQIPPKDRQILRAKLIVEEVIDELLPAMGVTFDKKTGKAVMSKEPDLIQIADGIIDSIYVLSGCAKEYGIPLEECWDEVQRSNMSKEGGPVRHDGKILKPDSYSPPDLEKIILDKKRWSTY